MRLGVPHIHLAFMRFFGAVLLCVLILAFLLEMLAILRSKPQYLRVQPRWLGLLYWSIPTGLAILLLLWLVFGTHSSHLRL